ncbi:DsbA family protein [Candidatus Pacebacteria bacterium]|nr:DsbA family protein [Candidatus Paceibacterota bacterium]
MQIIQNNLTAISIMLGSALVSAVIVFTNMSPNTSLSLQRAEASAHRYGAAEAQTVIVEFSDYECPYCAQLHPTIEQIVDGSNGTIAWEYRHLPIASHSNALPGAIAAECVALHGDAESFWDFSTILFANQRQLSAPFIAATAQDFGVSPEQLAACQADPDIRELIESDTQTASAYGGSGTPFSVVLFPDGTTRPVTGALPYRSWQELLAL